MKKVLFTLVFVGITSALVLSCKDARKAENVEETVVIVEEQPVVALNTVWVIGEHNINDMPVTSKGAIKADAKEVPVTTEEAYEIATVDVLSEGLAGLEYESTEIITVEEAIIPLSETQTLTSYNKKGVEKAELQVISSGPDSEIEQIFFTDKNHKDVYDVNVGMTGKDVKKLRREMKHMLKHGKVFLQVDESNVMYLMDAKDSQGDEISVAEVDEMEVSAIIWKDKKHHKNN